MASRLVTLKSGGPSSRKAMASVAPVPGNSAVSRAWPYGVRDERVEGKQIVIEYEELEYEAWESKNAKITYKNIENTAHI